MANTNEKRTGPAEVDQGKNANEIFDATDDIPEKREITTEEKTRDDLARGEELYTGFGFGGTAATTSTNRTVPANENKANIEPTAQAEPPVIKTDEDALVVAEDNTTIPEATPTKKSTDDSPRVPAEKTTTTTSTEKIEVPTTNKTFDPTDERKVEWESSTDYTIRSTVTSTDATDKTPTSKENAGTIDLGKDTRVVIEAQGGEMTHHTDTITTYTPQKAHPVETGKREHVGHHEEILHTHHDNIPHHTRTTAYTTQQTPDYELAEVYYTKTPTGTYDQNLYGKALYDPALYEVSTIKNTLPIKKHYKNQAKQKKSLGIPWAKVAIGVAATLGAIGLVTHLTEDEDDGFFWQ